MASHEIPDITNPAVNQPALPGFEQLAEQAATPIIDPALLAVSIREAFRRGVDQATRPQEPPRENLFDEARQEAMENGSGMSAFVARAKLSGMSAEQLDKAVLDERGDMIRRAASGANAKAKGPKKPRGRSYPQDESRADAPELPNPTPLTVEEKKALAGKERAKVALDASVAMDRSLRKTARGDIRTHLALQRVRTEGRIAERRRLGLDV